MAPEHTILPTRYQTSCVPVRLASRLTGGSGAVLARSEQARDRGGQLHHNRSVHQGCGFLDGGTSLRRTCRLHAPVTRLDWATGVDGWADRRRGANHGLGREDGLVYGVELGDEVAAGRVVARGEPTIKLAVQGIAGDVTDARQVGGTDGRTVKK